MCLKSKYSFSFFHFTPMKKNLFIAALLCSISFAGNATTHKTKTSAVEKTAAGSTEVIKPLRAKLLYMMDFNCAAQGWTIPVVGYTVKQMIDQYQYYVDNLDC